MKRFWLKRIEDETGISGTGCVAQGVIFDDGSCVVRWLTDVRSTCVYSSIADVEKIHGHKGKTLIDIVDVN